MLRFAVQTEMREGDCRRKINYMLLYTFLSTSASEHVHSQTVTRPDEQAKSAPIISGKVSSEAQAPLKSITARNGDNEIGPSALFKTTSHFFHRLRFP
jgi:hypothetical protein